MVIKYGLSLPFYNQSYLCVVDAIPATTYQPTGQLSEPCHSLPEEWTSLSYIRPALQFPHAPAANVHQLVSDSPLCWLLALTKCQHHEKRHAFRNRSHSTVALTYFQNNLGHTAPLQLQILTGNMNQSVTFSQAERLKSISMLM